MKIEKNLFKLELADTIGINGDGSDRQKEIESLKIGDILKISLYIKDSNLKIGIYNLNGSLLGNIPNDYVKILTNKVRDATPTATVSNIYEKQEHLKSIVLTLDFNKGD